MANITPRRKRNLKDRLLAEFGPYCCYCKEWFPKEQLTLEHLIAKADGGPNAYWNLRLACFPCNHGRHHPPATRFRGYRFDL
jgi:5-methylcytosine-specific restriction endonuclease McrA